VSSETQLDRPSSALPLPFSLPLIPLFSEETKCPFPIYADPKVATFKALNMTTELDPLGAKKPNYLRNQSTFSNVVGSIWSGLSHLRLVKKGGDYK